MWKRLKQTWNAYKNVAAVRGLLLWVGWWQTALAFTGGFLVWLWARVKHLQAPEQFILGLAAFALILVCIRFGVWILDRRKPQPKAEAIEPPPVLPSASATRDLPADAARTSVKANHPPVTLKQLFEIDWPNLPAFYHECILNSQTFESGSVKVAWRVNGDFVGRSKFLAILIDPTTKVSDAFKACEAIADSFAYFLDSVNSEVDIQGQAPDDTAPTHLKDMVFSKRIFIYYEDFSLPQKGMLETTYQNKGLSVQFRDAAYAWAHREDKPREKPLVPNTTILPDAKLTPGLRIKITKLSPGTSPS
jgi:hypothetical protein